MPGRGWKESVNANANDGGDRGRLPTFEQLAHMPDDDLDVELGAALIARDTYDGLDVRGLLDELSALGAPLAALGAPATDEPGAAGRSLRERVVAVSEHFTSLGFRGNTDDYYDPKNSLLPDVLAKKTGIPITLSIVWCAIARRAGLDARGVAFPGHFLVRVDAAGSGASDEPVIVDPFASGRLVDSDAATALLRRALGDGAELHPSLFTPASARATLVRLLTNLESTWAKRGEHARAFLAIDRIVTLVPDSARMLRERAALALRIGATEVARSDLARVVELDPQAPDIPHIEARLAKLASTLKSTLH
jgi:regulator of sirC expression with transglutaminase-like and TPR domain